MTGSVAPGSHIQTKASPADATSEVILHLGSRLVNGLGKQAQLRFLLGEMSSETVPVAVEQRDPDDRCRLEDEADGAARSEEHTSELQSLMRISYAVFCL